MNNDLYEKYIEDIARGNFVCDLVAKARARTCALKACSLLSLGDNIEMKDTRDPGLDALLLLDGEMFFADAAGKYLVKFAVKRVAPSVARPHGLSYSLTLHGAE